MIIKTYGLFWTREKVRWGEPGRNNKGSLKGTATRSSRRAKSVDFRDQRGIYALYDNDYNLVYVGQTGANRFDRLFKRLKGHRTDHLADRWTKFSWFGALGVTKPGELSTDTDAFHESVKSTLDTLEAIVIAIAEPQLNLQRGKWGQAKQYYQASAFEGATDDEGNNTRIPRMLELLCEHHKITLDDLQPTQTETKRGRPQKRNKGKPRKDVSQ